MRDWQEAIATLPEVLFQNELAVPGPNGTLYCGLGWLGHLAGLSDEVLTGEWELIGADDDSVEGWRDLVYRAICALWGLNVLDELALIDVNDDDYDSDAERRTAVAELLRLIARRHTAEVAA